MMRRVKKISRRTFLAASAGAFVVACGGSNPAATVLVDVDNDAEDGEPVATPVATATPTATSTATPVPPTPTPTPFPTGEEVRTLMEGTPSATPLVIRHSGVEGPVVMILGGVHGNEPGSWLATDVIADWVPDAGSLLVVPRANVIALENFVRTYDDLGDLNRLYPGNPESDLPMERMSHQILEAAREFGVELLLDLHESWAFYAEYPPDSGTGALGQTITVGVGPQQHTFGPLLAERVNLQVTAREEMLVRDGTRFSRPPRTPEPGRPNRGRSSLSAGGHVPGLTPVLIEMGQENQELERRIHLHQVTARAALELTGVFRAT